MAEANILPDKFHHSIEYIQSREQVAESTSAALLIKTAELSALKIYSRDIER